MEQYIIFSKDLDQFISEEDMIEGKGFFQYALNSFNEEDIHVVMESILSNSKEYKDFQFITQKTFESLR